MRSRPLVLPAALAVLGAAGPALAQQPAEDIDAERFKPALTHDAFVTVEGSSVRPELNRFELGLILNYARSSLVVVDAGGSLTDQYVSGRMGVDLFGSVTVVGPFAIGLGVPLFLLQTGDGSPSFGGIGDVRLAPKLRIVDGSDGGFGLALLAELRAPTHAGDFAGGARNVVFAPRMIADVRTGGLHLGANLGVALREKTEFVDVEAGSELTYGGALGYRFGGDGVLELGAEAVGGVGFAAADVEELPLEALPFLKLHPSEEWEITAGPGIGLVPGYGVPILRAFAGVRYSPTRPDRDRDGIADDEDKCPDEPENLNRVEDTDGCPDEDGDQDVDGVADSVDECPKEKETINGIQDEDGCADGGPAKVIREEGQIRILENVRFRSGSAQIEPASYSVLDQVALTMKANPDIERLRVEGHTDETGDRELNMQLSKSRAKAVRDYLVRKGVRPQRLTSEGYGPDKPLAEGKDPSSMAKNRRVEFVIED